MRWADLHWATSVYAAPAVEPLTVAEVKAHLRLDNAKGEPAPTAVTVALIVAAGNVTAGAHRYLATFVTADGETEAGSVSSAVTTILATHGQVALSAIPLGGSAVTSRKLYRTAAGGSTYLLLATLANNTATSYTDNIADGSLGAQAPTVNTTADPELVAWIAAARIHTEDITGRTWVNQTRDLVLDQFPTTWSDYSRTGRSSVTTGSAWRPYQTGLEPIRLPRLPLVSVTSITYVDTDSATQTWSSTLYDVDTTAGRIAPKFGQVYPTAQYQQNAITVRFVCGYGTAASAVPSAVKAAMKLLIGHWYEHRESVNIGNITSELPQAVAALLSPYKVY